MSKERADLGFADALEDFDPADWKPAAPHSAPHATPHAELDTTQDAVSAPYVLPRPGQAATAKAAAVAGFRSREPTAEKRQRRRRTGRNVQFNLKAKPETIDAFCAVADHQGWGLGETLEKAVELLLREYKR